MLNLRAIPLLLLAIALAACSSAKRGSPAATPHLGTRPGSRSAGPRYDAEAPAAAPESASRAGSTRYERERAYDHEPEDEALGTVYGERRFSDSYETRFERASSRPDGVISLWYNDYDRVTARTDSPWRTSSLHDRRTDVTVSLVDGRGRVLEALDVGRQRYAVGEPGERYEIEVTNHSPVRFEVVASVDGLDVIDGDPASTHKRGYILEPYATLVIDGWRTYEDEVAAFRFGHVEDSYAARRGAPRDIGVIGVALFAERVRRSRDWERRRRARPFDDRFAPPPGW